MAWGMNYDRSFVERSEQTLEATSECFLAPSCSSSSVIHASFILMEIKLTNFLLKSENVFYWPIVVFNIVLLCFFSTTWAKVVLYKSNGAIIFSKIWNLGWLGSSYFLQMMSQTYIFVLRTLNFLKLHLYACPNASAVYFTNRDSLPHDLFKVTLTELCYFRLQNTKINISSLPSSVKGRFYYAILLHPFLSSNQDLSI